MLMLLSFCPSPSPVSQVARKHSWVVESVLLSMVWYGRAGAVARRLSWWVPALGRVGQRLLLRGVLLAPNQRIIVRQSWCSCRPQGRHALGTTVSAACRGTKTKQRGLISSGAGEECVFSGYWYVVRTVNRVSKITESSTPTSTYLCKKTMIVDPRTERKHRHGRPRAPSPFRFTARRSATKPICLRHPQSGPAHHGTPSRCAPKPTRIASAFFSPDTRHRPV